MVREKKIYIGFKFNSYVPVSPCPNLVDHSRFQVNHDGSGEKKQIFIYF